MWGMSKGEVLLTFEVRSGAPVGILGAASSWFSASRAKVGLVWEKLLRVRWVWSHFLSIAAEP